MHPVGCRKQKKQPSHVWRARFKLSNIFYGSHIANSLQGGLWSSYRIYISNCDGCGQGGTIQNATKISTLSGWGRADNNFSSKFLRCKNCDSVPWIYSSLIGKRGSVSTKGFLYFLEHLPEPAFLLFKSF